MQLDNKQIKRLSAEIFRKTLPRSLAATAVFVALLFLFSWLSVRLSGFTDDVIKKFVTYYTSGNFEKAQECLNSVHPSTFQDFARTLLQLAAFVLEAGYLNFIIKNSRGEEPDVGSILEVFPSGFKFVCLKLLSGFIIVVFSLLLIVPGIIAAYSFRMAPFLLLDEPQTGIIEALKKSRLMMKGNKMRLFKLDMSYILLYLASAIPTIGLLVSLSVLPLTRTSYYIFYSELCGSKPFVSQPMDDSNN